MAILIKHTKKAHELGFTTIEIHRGRYGYSASDTRYSHQKWHAVRDTPDEVIEDLKAGKLPVNMMRERPLKKT